MPVPGADPVAAPLAAELRAIVAADPVDLSQAALVIAMVVASATMARGVGARG